MMDFFFKKNDDQMLLWHPLQFFSLSLKDKESVYFFSGPTIVYPDLRTLGFKGTIYQTLLLFSSFLRVSNHILP